MKSRFLSQDKVKSLKLTHKTIIMKKIKLLLIAAILLTASVSCDKENNDNNNAGGDDVSIQDNMAQVGNHVTTLTSELWFDDYGTAYINAFNNGQNGEVHFSCTIAWNSLGKSFDLSSGLMDIDYNILYEYLSETETFEFSQTNFPDGSIRRSFNFGDHSDSPVFTSGTLTTSRNDDGQYTLTINGTLIDGTTVDIKLKAKNDSEIIPLTSNSVIYDGVKYTFNTTATRNGGTNNVNWNGIGENGVTTSGTIYYGSNNLHIPLQLNPTGDGYYFDFNITLPNFELSYSWNNDLMTGTLDGEAFSSTPFTEGDAEISTYNGLMHVYITGTLSNGKTLKLDVTSEY